MYFTASLSLDGCIRIGDPQHRLLQAPAEIQWVISSLQTRRQILQRSGKNVASSQMRHQQEKKYVRRYMKIEVHETMY